MNLHRIIGCTMGMPQCNGFAGLFSTDSQTYQFVTNKQIGQSGANSVALSGDVAGNLNISSSDPQVAQAAINAAGQNQLSALETLRSVADRFGQVAETATAGAQNTALNALPLTPDQISASRGDASKAQTQSTLLKLGAGIAGLIVILVAVKHFKH